MKSLLDLPENLSVLCVIAIGCPDDALSPYHRDELLWGNVSYGRFGGKKA